MKRSQQYRQMARDVAEFRDAYRAVLSNMRFSQVGFMTEARPKAGHEATAAGAMTKASQLAGKAQFARDQSGVLTTFTIPLIGIPIDPVTAWDYSLKDPEALSPGELINVYNTIIGALEERAERAEHTERTLAGKVAALVGFPAQVRSVVEEWYPSYGKRTGRFAQIATEVLAALIVAAATAGAVALWKSVTHSAPAPAPSRQPITPVTGPAPTGPATPAPAPSRT